MRTLLVIGIGVGDPDHLTLQAITAMRRADVFFGLDKGAAKADLLGLRKEICERHLGDRDYRFVELTDPQRDRQPASYETTVLDWHAERAALVEQSIRAELPDGGVGAILVWGDPSLYDSTLRVLKDVQLDLSIEVIPGITSVQALAASHGIVLNRIGASVLITTGRLLREGWPPGVEDVVVMLDADCAFRDLDEDLDIWWGAFLGSSDELLVSGDAREVADEIMQLRAEGKERRGWIMDVYLLRRRSG